MVGAASMKSSSPTSALPRLDARLVFFACLFLFSGFASLIYQVAWERMLQVYFGVSTYSVTLIVAAYMCGMGLGYLWGGRWSQRIHAPLQTYGLVEAGIGLFGLVSLQLLNWIGRSTAGSPLAVVFILSFLMLLAPTVLMGATLPFLSQGFIRRVETAGQVIGLLYGINTLGAAFGALISAYVLIGWVGLSGSVIIAAAINLLVGLAAWGSARYLKLSITPAAQEPAAVTPAGNDGPRWRYTAILAASFLSGFIGLGYEMLWVRVLGILNKHSAYSFPTILFILLSGLAVGGYLFGKRADRTRRPGALLWKIELAVSITAGLCFALIFFLLDLAPVASYYHDTFSNFQQPQSPFSLIEQSYVFFKRQALSEFFIFLLPSLVLILPATLWMGGGLPILDRIAIENPDLAGRRVGDVHLANIGGSVAGTLLISLVLIPGLGSEWTLKILGLLSLGFLLLDVAHWPRPRRRQVNARAAAGYAFATLAILAALPYQGQFYGKLYAQGLRRPFTLEEGRDSVLVLTWHDKQQTSANELWIGGELHSLFPTSKVYLNIALGCTAVNHPRSVLIIGFGGGNTAEFFTRIPGVERIVIVELMQNLAPFLEPRLPSVQAILNDPRVTYIADDGRRYLYANPGERFDLITMDPLRNYTAGSNNLYSQEALALYQQRLTPGGILCAWKDEHRFIPATAAAVFPYVDDFDRFFIARQTPIQYDLQALETNTRTTPLKDPVDVLGSFMRDQQLIRRQESGHPLLSDTTPYLEYYFLRTPPDEIDRRLRDDLPAFFARIPGCDAVCQTTLMNKMYPPVSP